jgi:hypothetical protein
MSRHSVRRGRRGSRGQGGHRRRSGWEALEVRALLALTWTGASQGDDLWSDPANWDGLRAPVPGDVLIFNDGPTVIRHSSTDDLDLTLGGLQVNWSGSINLTKTLTVNGTFAQGSSDISGGGDLDLDGASTWSGGSMSGSGTLNVAANATLALSGASGKALNRPMTLSGMLTWTDAGSLTLGGPSLSIQPGAVFNIQGDAAIDTAPSAQVAFTNVGTLEKTAGNGVTTLQNTGTGSALTFHNTGTISVQSGTLAFANAQSSSDGPGNMISLAAGTHADLTGPSGNGATTRFATTDTVITGVGSLRLLPGADLTVNGLVATQTFEQSGGVLDGPGQLRIDGHDTWTAGTMAGSGSTRITPAAILDIAGSAPKVLQGRRLDVAGTANWTDSGPILGGGGASINIFPGGIFLAAGDAAFNANDPAGALLNNQGILRKSGTSGTTALNGGAPGFSNTGLVDVRSGILSIQSPGTSSGSGNTFTIASGSRVDVAGPLTATGTSFTGPGTLRLTTGGALSANGVVTAQNVLQDGGSLAGPGRFRALGQYTWTGGAMAGPGVTEIPSGARLDLAGVGTKSLQRTLNNAGVATWSGGPILMGSAATLDNTGLFDITSDGSLDTLDASAPTFLNEGTLRKSAGPGTTTLRNSVPGSRLTLNNLGTLNVQSGTLSLSGALANLAGTTLSGGSYLLTGTFAVAGANIATNAAAITLNGPGAKFADTNGADALAHLADNAAGGSLTLSNGRALATGGDLRDEGALTLGPGTTLAPGGDLIQASGVTTLAMATIAPHGGDLMLNGGVLSGSGIVAGNLANGGRVEPGGVGSIGVIGVAGSFRQSASGVLHVELAGSADGQHDLVVAIGDATLGGTLSGGLLGGFTPRLGDAFRTLTFRSHSGDFAAETGLSFGPRRLRADYSATDLTLRDVPTQPTLGDYDGDGKTDISVYRPSTGQWLIAQSGGGARVVTFGAPNTDIPVPADYDGDGKTDLAVFRPSTGQWIIQQSTGGTRTIALGAPTDIPVPGDYDGDGKADIAVYRPSTGQWIILRSSDGPEVVNFGAPNVDRPVPGDYDGDGKADIAVYRPTTGQWLILQSSGGPRVQNFGAPGLDVPVPADYDGDGKTDLAVYRPSTGQWLILQSTGGPRAQTLGLPNVDTPVPGDYDGDGKADLAIYRTTTGQWVLLQSSGGTRLATWGIPGLDVPLTPPLAYRYPGRGPH